MCWNLHDFVFAGFSSQCEHKAPPAQLAGPKGFLHSRLDCFRPTDQNAPRAMGLAFDFVFRNMTLSQTYCYMRVTVPAL